jgi:hypothetical protein
MVRERVYLGSPDCFRHMVARCRLAAEAYLRLHLGGLAYGGAIIYSSSGVKLGVPPFPELAIAADCER